MLFNYNNKLLRLTYKNLDTTVSKKKDIKKIFSKYSWVFLLKDPIYGSYLINKLINCLMFCGKKHKAENLVYNVFSNSFYYKSGFFYFFELIQKIRPGVDLVNCRLGKDVLKVPIPLNINKSYNKAVRLFVKTVFNKEEDRTLLNKISNELILSHKLKNKYFNKLSNDIKSTAFKNRSFSHYRWTKKRKF